VPRGGSDILARIIGPQVSEALGQSVVVENRPGGGTVGVGITVRSDPDGYTLILVPSIPPHCINASTRSFVAGCEE